MAGSGEEIVVEVSTNLRDSTTVLRTETGAMWQTTTPIGDDAVGMTVDAVVGRCSATLWTALLERDWDLPREIPAVWRIPVGGKIDFDCLGSIAGPASRVDGFPASRTDEVAVLRQHVALLEKDRDRLSTLVDDGAALVAELLVEVARLEARLAEARTPGPERPVAWTQPRGLMPRGI